MTTSGATADYPEEPGSGEKFSTLVKITQAIRHAVYSKIIRKLLFPNGLKRTLTIGDIKLSVDILDPGGASYRGCKSYEEKSSQLYKLISRELKPAYAIDVGANYGLISVIAAQQFPAAKIIAIEPSTALIPYIKENFAINNVENYQILNSICGEAEKDDQSFSINPASSQDNRVIASKSDWGTDQVNMVRIDSLLKESGEEDAVFIKIDTQGYEEKVFKGAEQFLDSSSNWLIKTEFAPHWLDSQGTDPKNLLLELVTKYDVAELPATIPFLTGTLDQLFANKLEITFVDDFLRHIIGLNENGRGWVDLIIRPK